MTEGLFRFVILLNVVLGTLAFFASTEFTAKIPEPVLEAARVSLHEPSNYWLTHKPSYLLQVLGLALAAIGWVGMFFFWRPARFFFAAGLLVHVAVYLTVDDWFAITRRRSIFISLQQILSGFVLAITFFGPAEPLFRNKSKWN